MGTIGIAASGSPAGRCAGVVRPGRVASQGGADYLALTNANRRSVLFGAYRRRQSRCDPSCDGALSGHEPRSARAAFDARSGLFFDVNGSLSLLVARCSWWPVHRVSLLLVARV